MASPNPIDVYEYMQDPMDLSDVEAAARVYKGARKAMPEDISIEQELRKQAVEIFLHLLLRKSPVVHIEASFGYWTDEEGRIKRVLENIAFFSVVKPPTLQGASLLNGSRDPDGESLGIVTEPLDPDDEYLPPRLSELHHGVEGLECVLVPLTENLVIARPVLVFTDSR